MENLEQFRNSEDLIDPIAKILYEDPQLEKRFMSFEPEKRDSFKKSLMNLMVVLENVNPEVVKEYLGKMMDAEDDSKGLSYNDTKPNNNRSNRAAA